MGAPIRGGKSRRRQVKTMQEQIVKVATFNLKRDGRFNPRTWEHRRKMAAKVIHNSGASIIGVQELLPSMREDIQQLLGNYSFFGWGRKKDLGDEHADIIVKNQDIDVLFHDTFWLSKKPQSQGSRYAFAIFPRVCTVAEVYFKQSHRRLRVFNTHFDHLLPMSRVLGVNVIFQRIQQYQQIDPLPTILMGDLNATPDSLPVRLIRENRHGYDFHFTDVFSTLAQSGQGVNTFHYFKGKDRHKTRFDYIFVTQEFDILDVALDKYSIRGIYPSDHYPILTTLRLPGEAPPAGTAAS